MTLMMGHNETNPILNWFDWYFQRRSTITNRGFAKTKITFDKQSYRTRWSNFGSAIDSIPPSRRFRAANFSRSPKSIHWVNQPTNQASSRHYKSQVVCATDLCKVEDFLSSSYNEVYHSPPHFLCVIQVQLAQLRYTRQDPHTVLWVDS